MQSLQNLYKSFDFQYKQKQFKKKKIRKITKFRFKHYTMRNNNITQTKILTSLELLTNNNFKKKFNKYKLFS